MVKYAWRTAVRKEVPADAVRLVSQLLAALGQDLEGLGPRLSDG
jgi:hypothetical protein